jgi:hypothetical protein
LGDGRDGCSRPFSPDDLDPAAPQDQIFGIGFQHLRGYVEQLLAYFAASRETCGAKRDRRPAAADAHIITGSIRVGGAHNDILGRRPSALATICGSDCIVEPEPIQRPPSPASRCHRH